MSMYDTIKIKFDDIDKYGQEGLKKLGNDLLDIYRSNFESDFLKEIVKHPFFVMAGDKDNLEASFEFKLSDDQITPFSLGSKILSDKEGYKYSPVKLVNQFSLILEDFIRDKLKEANHGS
jgi:hypothetical protein